MKTNKTVTFAGLCLAISIIISCNTNKEVRLESPDGAYEFLCYLNEEADEIYYSLSFRGREVIQASRLGYVFSKDGEETRRDHF